MKKILAMVLTLALVCGMALPATAADFDVSADTDVIEAGDIVTVTVSLNEALSGVIQLMLEIEYDWDALSYDKANPYVLGDVLDPNDAFVTISKKAPIVKVNCTKMNVTGASYAAGTVISIPFTANEATTVADIEFTISGKVNGVDENLEPWSEDITADSVTVTVCPGHEWEVTGQTGSCTEDGVIIETCSHCGVTCETEVEATGHVYTGMADWTDYIYDENYNMLEVIQHECCDVCFEDLNVTTYTAVNLGIDESWELILPPVMVPNETPEVAPGESANLFLNNFGGMVVLVYGDDITVSVSTPAGMWDPTLTTVEYTSVDGVVTIPVPTYAAYVTITNNGTETTSYKLEAYIPEGDMMNPIVGEVGEQIIHQNENDMDGMYVEFTATCNGWVHITVSGDYWNFNTYYDGDPDSWEDDHYGYYYFDVPEDGNTDSIYMTAGSTVRINLGSSYVEGEDYWDREWFYPEADLTLTIIPEYDHEGHIVHVDAVAPDCYSEGNIEYWYCECCEMFWQDAELTQLTNSKNVILPATHNHIAHVDAVAPSCYAEGNIEYWYCEDCLTVWSDENMLQITNFKNVILPATHQNVIHVDAIEPGCHYAGNIEYWYCADCYTCWQNEGQTQLTNIKNVVLPATGEGNVVHFDAVEPGCHSNGNIEYWICYDCEQVWQNEALTQLTNIKNVILPATGSENVIHFEAVEPGCHSNGNIEYWFCPDCEGFWADEACTKITNSKSVILPATGSENVVHFEAVEPGCHSNGNIEYWFCPDCEGFWADEACTKITNSKSVTLPATGSENVIHFEAVAPGCHSNGNIEYWFCPDCEGFWTDEACTKITNSKSVILPATGSENVVHFEAVAPGCHSNGNIEYWFCPDCEGFWTDEACTKITNSKSVILPATGSENVVHFEAVAPGCHSNGNIEYWFCPDCEGFWTDAACTKVTNSKSVILPATGSENVVHFEAVEPGCHMNGNIEYWFCPDCEGFWTDAACTKVTNSKSVILPATGEGNVEHFDAVAPGCHYDGNIEYWVCYTCEQVWQDKALTQVTNIKNVVLPATGEGNVVHFDAVAPGCHFDGCIEHWVCYTCEKVWQDEALTQLTNIKNVTLPATGEGNVVHFEAVAPGCHMAGCIEHWVCYDCEQVWQDEALTQLTNIKNVVLPELGGDVIHVEAKDASCTENGCIEHWYCESCEQVWQDEARTQLTNHMNVIIGAHGHNYGEDGVCTICGDNPKTGDSVSLAVAALIISAMSIVALPVAKKHF